MEPSKSLPDRQASGGGNAGESIKIRSEGLTILADPPSADLDVVFVHGLTGHPRHTWTFGKDIRDTPRADNGDKRPWKLPRLFLSDTSSKTEVQMGVFWPLDLLKETLPNARIATYGYDSKLRHRLQGSVSQSTILDLGQNLLVDLETFRQSQPDRRLIFVAHSLGGIIVKEALRRSEGHRVYQRDFYKIYDATIALMFFGTPHRGADPFGLLRGISETLIGLAGYTFNDHLLNGLLPNSERLKELREEFSKMSRTKNWLVYSFQEEYGLRRLNGKKVVEDTSSNLDDPTVEVTQHIAGDHMGICRFKGMDDSQYDRVVGAFRRLNRLGFLQNPQADVDTNDEVLKDCLESLAFKQIDDRLKNIRKAHSRTCEWLLQQIEYKNWHDRTKASNHHGFLWIKGKPGAGKSTIMKYAFQQSKNNPAGAIIVSYFFNARGDALEKSTIGMYRSIVYQLLLAIPHLQAVFFERFSKKDAVEAPEWIVEDLQEFLLYTIKNSRGRRIVVYIDALDECEEDEVRKMIEFLEDMGREAMSLSTSLSICLSSRHYPHISIKKGIQLIVEGQQGHVRDIALYVNSKLEAQGQRAKLEDIKSEILQRASGVFLWVVLVVQMLNKAFDHGRMHEMEKLLKKIPDELNDLFADILSRDTDNLDDSILLLQWVLFARRPLKPIELHLAVISGTDSAWLKSQSEHQINLENTKRFILSSSKGLVEISKSKDQAVQFIHESVRDFFLKKDGLARLCPQQCQSPSGLAEDRLRECCYQYITIDKIQDFVQNLSSPPLTKGEKDSVTRAFPFLEYAVQNIFAHSNEAEYLGVPQASFLNEYYVEDNSRMREWSTISNMFERFQIRTYPHTTSILYILSEHNLSSLVKLLLSQGADPNYVGSHRRFQVPRYALPLQAASANGHFEIVRMLRNAGARVNESGGEFGNALTAAIRRHRHPVVKALLEDSPIPGEIVHYSEALRWAIQENDEFVFHSFLETGASPNITFGNGKTALLTAIEKGYPDLAEKLLRSGADFSMMNEDKDKLLLSVIASKAAGFNPGIRRVEMVDLLLKNGASINTTDDLGYTALLLAFKHRHDPVIASLLKKGADIHAKNQNGDMPLHLAFYLENEALVKLLLEKGADVHAKNKEGIAPLHRAASSANGEAVARLLLEKGADVHAKTNIGNTPLHIAASSAHGEAVDRLLLEKGADVHAKNNYGDTPLHEAASLFHGEATVELLLEKGADVHAKNKKGDTPLHWAIERHCTANAKLLLEKGADPNIKNERGDTLLHWAARSDYKDVVKLLLETGADPNIKNEEGDTLLLWAAHSSYEDVVELLLEKGADIHAINSQGETLLYSAASLGYSEAVVKLLLQKGADPHSKNKEGDTALHKAAYRGYTAIIKLLLEKGACIHAKNDVGDTPLHKAAFQQNTAVTKLLLEKGADVHAKNQNGDMPLRLAISLENEALVKLLLEKGADVHAKNKEGITPLHRAVSLRNEVLVKLLLEKGADVHAKNKEGIAPLHRAVSLRNEALVKLLLEKGADPNMKNRDGDTPLHLAACSDGGEAFVKLLLEKGADPNMKNRDGDTLLHLAACSDGGEAFVKLLLENGADIHAKDRYGRTPLDVAHRWDREAYIKLLLEKRTEAGLEERDEDNP